MDILKRREAAVKTGGSSDNESWTFSWTTCPRDWTLPKVGIECCQNMEWFSQAQQGCVLQLGHSF